MDCRHFVANWTLPEQKPKRDQRRLRDERFVSEIELRAQKQAQAVDCPDEE